MAHYFPPSIYKRVEFQNPFFHGGIIQVLPKVYHDVLIILDVLIDFGLMPPRSGC